MPSAKRIQAKVLARTVVAIALVLAARPAAAQGPEHAPDQGPAQGQRQSPGAAAYDIPSQNLAAALSAYASTSGVQVLYETTLTVGRRSTAVNGVLTADAALAALLAGSGLVGRRTDVDAITVIPEQPERLTAWVAPVPPDRRFLGALQARILGALCGSPDIRPGTYRAALQLWITPAGAVSRAGLLGSTGDARRDALLIGALHDVAIGAQPPAGMWQPVIMTIVPHAPREGAECHER